MNFIRGSMSLQEQVILSLKVFRKNKKITQSELADRIGVSRDTIARLESGKARMYLDVVEQIANALDIFLKDLLLQDEQEDAIKDTDENTSLSNKNNNYNITYLSNLNLARNPYLDEKAVVSYGEPMKKYILDHRLFWHWVPVDDLPGLSISSVVEATLNQGREEDIKWLFETIGVEKAADIFRQQIMGSRHGYSNMTKNYFEAYFKRHAPKNLPLEGS